MGRERSGDDCYDCTHGRATCPACGFDEPEGELVQLAFARMHPAYDGRTYAQVVAMLRATLRDLTVDQIAALTWTIEDYARSAASRSAAR